MTLLMVPCILETAQDTSSQVGIARVACFTSVRMTHVTHGVPEAMDATPTDQ